MVVQVASTLYEAQENVFKLGLVITQDNLKQAQETRFIYVV